MHGATESGQSRTAVGFLTKAMVGPKTGGDHGHSGGN